MTKIGIDLSSANAKKEYHDHKINSGSNVFRILPPVGKTPDGKDNKVPFAKWTISWMGVPGSLGKKMPYASPKSFGLKECPLYAFFDALKLHVEGLTAKFSAEKSPQEVKEILAPLNSFLNESKPKTVYLYNAVDKSNKLGRLSLKKTAHEKIIEKMKQYILEYNSDPTTLSSEISEVEGKVQYDSGIWFDITRKGTNVYDTEYSVDFARIKTKDKGRMVEYVDTSPLPDSLIRGYESQAYDLYNQYKQKSFQELEQVMFWSLLQIVGEDTELIEGIPGYPLATILQKANSAPTATEASSAPVASAKKAPAKVTVSLEEEDLDFDDVVVAPPKAKAKKKTEQEELLEELELP